MKRPGPRGDSIATASMPADAVAAPAPESIVVPGRFNGPLESGQGGYSCGLVAELLEGPVEVSLRSPVSLDRSLAVARAADGSVRVQDRERLVAEARPAPGFAPEVPAPVSPADARLAAGRYRGLSEGVFSRCFVCGRQRMDALGVFAGTVEGRRVVASPWTPTPWTADAEGRVRPELVWAVLDCPTFFASYLDRDLGRSVLARQTARIDRPVVAGEEQVVIAWPIGTEGRKRHAGSAVLSAAGEVLAAARALLIEPRT